MLSRESTRSPGSAHASLRNEKARSVFLRHVSLLVEFSFSSRVSVLFFFYFLLFFSCFFYCFSFCAHVLEGKSGGKRKTENIYLKYYPGRFFSRYVLEENSEKTNSSSPRSSTPLCLIMCSTCPHQKLESLSASSAEAGGRFSLQALIA